MLVAIPEQRRNIAVLFCTTEVRINDACTGLARGQALSNQEIFAFGRDDIRHLARISHQDHGSRRRK